MDARCAAVKLLLFDVDGVMTDGGIVYGSAEMEIKRFDVQDGFGITMGKAAGLRIGLLTGRTSEMVVRRAKELGIDIVRQGHFDKLVAYEEICATQGLTDGDVAYMGDDILDLPVLERVGLSLAPANARPEVQARVHHVTDARGGHGAVREAVEYVLRGQERLDEIVAQFARGDVPAGSPG